VDLTENAAVLNRHIVTADDFGFDESVNNAIAASFSARLINSASIIVGAPAFGSAIKLARERKFSDAIGVHLNLTEGFPATESMRRDPAFCDATGKFHFTIPRSALWLSESRRKAVVAEFSRQIEIFINSGLTPTHLDSHHHVHNVWPIGSIVIELATRYHIPKVRLARNIGAGIGPIKRIFKTAYNSRLRYCGVARSDLMGNLSDYMEERPPTALRAELAVHPGFAADGIIVDREEKLPLEALLRKARLR